MTAKTHCDACDIYGPESDVKDITLIIGPDVLYGDLCKDCRETTPVADLPLRKKLYRQPAHV
jgi:hypothetical protein